VWNHAYLLDYSAVSETWRRLHWSPQSKKQHRRRCSEPNQLLPRNADCDAGRACCTLGRMRIPTCVCVCPIGPLLKHCTCCALRMFRKNQLLNESNRERLQKHKQRQKERVSGGRERQGDKSWVVLSQLLLLIRNYCPQACTTCRCVSMNSIFNYESIF